LDEAFISEEDAEVGSVEALSELFPGNQGNESGLKYAFELIAKQEEKLSGSCLKVGVVKTLEQSAVNFGTLGGLVERTIVCEIMGDNDDGLVDELYLLEDSRLVEEKVDVFVDEFGRELCDGLFFGE